METGFPSPAQDYFEHTIDLNDLLISNPPATFLMRIKGSGLKQYGLDSGDIAIIDRSHRPTTENLVVVNDDGHLKLKKLKDEETADIWGCAKWILKKI